MVKSNYNFLSDLLRVSGDVSPQESLFSGIRSEQVTIVVRRNEGENFKNGLPFTPIISTSDTENVTKMQNFETYVISGIRHVGNIMEVNMKNNKGRRSFKLDDPKQHSWVIQNLRIGNIVTYNLAEQKIANESPLLA